MSRPNLTALERTDESIEELLSAAGQVFRAWRNQDSGCISFGVEVEDRRLFVKHSDLPRGKASLERARTLHRSFAHPAVPGLLGDFETPGGLALVYEWAEGELLYAAGGRSERQAPDSVHSRFREEPLSRVLAVLDAIHEVHLLLAEGGFTAVDFYDGCILFDFASGATRLIDFDEYRPGPFVLTEDRLPGSTRGSPDRSAWRATDRLHAVAVRASARDRGGRYPSVRAYVDAWNAAALDIR